MKRLMVTVVSMAVFVLLSLMIGAANQAFAEIKFTNTCTCSPGDVKQKTADIKIVNTCSCWITFYIDDVSLICIAPEKSQIVSATVGIHVLKAVSIESIPRAWSKSIALGAKGVVWTIETNQAD